MLFIAEVFLIQVLPPVFSQHVQRFKAWTFWLLKLFYKHFFLTRSCSGSINNVIIKIVKNVKIRSNE